MNFSEAEYAGKRKQTRREKFLSEMARTIPWVYLAGEVAKHYPLLTCRKSSARSLVH